MMSKYDNLHLLNTSAATQALIDAHRESVRKLYRDYHDILRNYRHSACREVLIATIRQQIHQHIITIRVLERIKL